MKHAIALLLFTALLGGCAGQRYHQQGLDLIQQGKVDEGLAALDKAIKEEPNNGQFRSDLLARRANYVTQLLNTAQSLRQAGKRDDAGTFYRHVLGIEPNNVRAQAGLDALTRDRRHDDIVPTARDAFKAGDTDKALALLAPVLTENPDNVEARDLKREINEHQARRQATEPTLKSSYTKPINLEFREANVKMVFEVLARTTGISFIFDKDVRPDLRTTVFLKNASIEDAIDLILQTNQLQKKVLNSTTVLIYPGTPEKLKDYQDLVVRAFYLSNANVKDVQSSIKTLLKTKDTVIDEKLNMLVMRDTPEAIRLAEKIVAMHDLAEPEVMLEVEVLEVQRNRLLDLGVQWPNQLTLTPLSKSSGGSLTLNDLKHLNGDRLGAALPNMIIKVDNEKSDANLLANPRIRVRNREKAKILIGNKVPVVTTTSTATGLVSDSVQYIDVGLKVEVQPDIRLRDEVAINVNLEVSSIVKQITSPSGTVAYQIGTRNADTMLSLKDGETQILAGLINDEDRRSANGIPGLGELPVLGRLFSSNQDNHQKTEIVLSITPHLIRNLVRPDASQGEFWSGTESALRTKPLTLQPMVQPTAPEKPVAPPSGEATTPAPGSSFDTLTNAPKTSVAAKTVNLTWQGPAQVKVGDQFKVALKLKADGALRSLPFQVAFDATAFQAVEIAEGTFFKQNNGTTSFSSNIDQANGKLFVTVARSDTDGVAGEESVVVLTFRALVAKPQAEVKLLSASPIIQGDKPPTLALPAPYVVTVVQ